MENTYTQKQVNEIIKKHAIWLKSRRGRYRANFSNAKFDSISFIGANLKYADLSFSKFTNCWFDLADLTYSNFQYSEFTNCSFEQANMQDASLSGASIENCDFYLTNLAGAALNVTRCDEIVNELFLTSFKMDMIARRTRDLPHHKEVK